MEGRKYQNKGKEDYFTDLQKIKMPNKLLVMDKSDGEQLLNQTEEIDDESLEARIAGER